MSRSVAVWSRIVAAIALIASASVASAQDPEEPEEQPGAQVNFDLSEQNFFMWVYGQANPTGNGQAHLEAILAMNLVEIEQNCTLTDAQKKKLRLAGRGDIKHFLDRVAEAHKVFEMYRHDQNGINVIYQETIPLSKAFNAGLFGADSFFSKTLAATLGPEQQDRYRQAVYEKALFRHQAKLRLAITNLDTAIGFTTEQRDRLIELAFRETKPPARPAGQYEAQVVLLKIAKIPEEKLRPIFDDRRWQSLDARLKQARARELFLQTNGYLDVLDPVEAKKN